MIDESWDYKISINYIDYVVGHIIYQKVAFKNSYLSPHSSHVFLKFRWFVK